MSLLKGLFSSRKSEAAEAAPAAASASVPAPARTTAGAGELLRCEAINWNPDAQLRLLRDVLPAMRRDLERVASAPPRTPAGGSPHSPADLALLWAMIAHLKPSRIIEVGCGPSTHVVRESFRTAGLAGEIIGIDPAPGLEIGEMVDAQLSQPVWEVPVADFEMLAEGELLLLNLSHVPAAGSDVWWAYTRVLPALRRGVIVGVHGIDLPREHPAPDLERGWAEQALLHAFLSGNAAAEVLYAGGWLHETNGADLAAALPGIGAHRSRMLWFRVG